MILPTDRQYIPGQGGNVQITIIISLKSQSIIDGLPMELTNRMLTNVPIQESI